MNTRPRTLRRPYAPPVIRAGLIGDYYFDEGVGTAVFDHSPAGNHGTFGLTTHAPTWGPTGLTFASPQYVTIPTPAASIVSVQCLCTSTGSGLQAIVGTDASSFSWTIYPSPTSLCSTPAYDNAGGDSISSLSFGLGSTTEAYAHTLGTSPAKDAHYVGVASKPATLGQPSSGAIARTGNLAIGYNVWIPGSAFLGRMHRLLLYSRQISADEVAQNVASFTAVARRRGLNFEPVNPSATRQLTAHGDSIVVGLSGSNWPNGMTLAQTYTRYNVAQSSQLMAQINQYDFDLIRPLYAPNAPVNAVVVMAGTNDFFQSTAASVAAVFGFLTSFVNAMVGSGRKVVVVPMISRTGNGTQGAFNGVSLDSLMASYNALIWGFSWPSGVSVIQANDANMGSGSGFNFFAAGANANTTYYNADGTHPKTAGSTQLGLAVAPYVNALG